jgi:ubiquinone/menaquinone biosynthesis C-methylase UbiE
MGFTVNYTDCNRIFVDELQRSYGRKEMIMSESNLITENRNYWSKRAATYSFDIREEELGGALHHIWLETIDTIISSHFCEKPRGSISVLDIGTGPGFFSVILAEAGYKVTAIDFSPSMLDEAKMNAGVLVNKITFHEMNAEELRFNDASFDVIITRNLTWNLPHPDTAYTEWHRVLKPRGLLLNFDANWYRYLYNDEARILYDEDRKNAKAAGIHNDNPDVDYSDMEQIALEIPLSRIMRPDWDIAVLSSLGFSVYADTDIWKKLWSEEDKINFASTPMFMIHAVK